MKKPFKNYIYIVFAIVIATILSLFLAEAYCRVKGLYRLENFSYMDYPNMNIWKSSNFLPFEAEPNIPGLTNSLGMRDKARLVAKNPGIYRIVVLGDSITMFGEYVKYLEELLNKQYGGRFEVWNCGIGGHGVKEYYYNLRYRCLGYNPDMIIAGLCLNDFYPAPVMFKNKEGQLHCYRPFNIFRGSFDNFLYCHSNFYRLIMVKIEEKALKNYYNFDSFGALYLSRIQAIAAKKKIPLLAIIFPYLDPDSESREEYRIMSNVIRKLNIDCIDLHSAFDKDDRLKFRRVEDDYIHPDSEAHGIAADVIKKYLEENILYDGFKN